jgi:hypothetical protein
MEGQSNAYHRFGYCRRDRIRCLVGLSGCAVEGWEGGCACVGPDLTACDYVALASRRNTGRILIERYRGFRATCNSPFPQRIAAQALDDRAPLLLDYPWGLLAFVAIAAVHTARAMRRPRSVGVI